MHRVAATLIERADVLEVTGCSLVEWVGLLDWQVERLGNVYLQKAAIRR